VITDLDDTLYSWIGFFIPAFYDMVSELSVLLNTPHDILIDEYHVVHQKVKSVEFPYATLQLPSVKMKYKNLPREDCIELLNPVFHRFNSTRKRLLKLYPGVEDTLKFLVANNIVVVGYTESAEENGFYRLKKLGIDEYFKDVFVSDSLYERPDYIPASPKTHIVAGKKPNPRLIEQICSNEGIERHNVLYLGDSLTKDILMAKRAGVFSVWCSIPQDDTKDLYNQLVAISHWTEEDFEQEKANKLLWENEKYVPDATIQSFEELQTIIMKLNNI